MGSSERRAVAVAVPGPFPVPLTYLERPELGSLEPGHAVLVPLGRRQVTGWVVAVDVSEPEGIELKKVQRLLEDEPVVTAELLELFRRVADYYLHPIGEVIKTALPVGERSESKNVLVVVEELINELPDLERQDCAQAIVRLLKARPRTKRALLAATLALGFEHGGRVLSQLEGSGAVVAQQRFHKKRRERVWDEWLRLNVEAAEAQRRFSRPGPVRDRLLLFMERRGWVTRSELVDQFSGAHRILGALNDLNLLAVEHRPQEIDIASVGGRGSHDIEVELTHDQANALEHLEKMQHRGGVHLLQGVTGSGKTEVYLRLAQQILDSGRGVLILVPEISLTPQLEERFRARLDAPMEVLHSGRTAAERHRSFRALLDGDARIALGVRSAVWAPVRELGLIIVDEEHDDSYKQDDGLRYHARDVAILRGHLSEVPVILGSATPSMESLHNAQSGRFHHLHLPFRVPGRALPSVERVALGKVTQNQEDHSRWLSEALLDALGQTMDAGEQALVLLNRRGFATFVVCTGCGEPFVCPDCSVSLVHHARAHRLRCHLCGWSTATPDTCPNCFSPELLMAGRGTERIEEELLARFPRARIERMDRDTTRRRGAHGEILERMRAGAIDILVGTQMIAKGHDLPGVTLVGVVHADSGLGVPDFRASERTFQLLTQVAGRAGRGTSPGRVIFQAIRPDHPVICAAALQDVAQFQSWEERRRKMAGWPPFGRIALLRLDGTKETSVRGIALRLVQRCRQNMPAGGRILGPVTPMAPLRGGRHYLHILLRALDRPTLRQWLVRNELWDVKAPAGVRIALDIDPIRLD